MELQWYLMSSWLEAGESWLAVNSRIVPICLQLSGKYPSGSQQFIFIISVYSPTHRAALTEVKEKFMVVCKQWSAQVMLFVLYCKGSLHGQLYIWAFVGWGSGKFGVGKINKSGFPSVQWIGFVWWMQFLKRIVHLAAPWYQGLVLYWLCTSPGVIDATVF